jgi:hypothetical protein
VRDQGDARLLAPLDHAAADGAVVEDAEGNLGGRDRRELQRFVELPPIDVRNAHVPDEPVVDQAGQGADRGRPGRALVGRVDEVEVDRQAVERGQARLAVGANRLRAPVGDPAAAVAPHAALGHDPSRRICATTA